MGKWWTICKKKKKGETTTTTKRFLDQAGSPSLFCSTPPPPVTRAMSINRLDYQPFCGGCFRNRLKVVSWWWFNGFFFPAVSLAADYSRTITSRKLVFLRQFWTVLFMLKVQSLSLVLLYIFVNTALYFSIHWRISYIYKWNKCSV